MKTDLPTLPAFIASAPFMADLGIEPVEGSPGMAVSALVSISFTEAEVHAERAGRRVLVAKASATMAMTAATPSG